MEASAISILAIFCLGSLAPVSRSAEGTKPLAGRDMVFEERAGVVAIEAEHFFEQTLAEKRAWHLTTRDHTPALEPDGDSTHIAGASGGAYLELLPDTRHTHDDKLIHGENFSNVPGKMAVLSYRVHFNTPGTYWLWARAFTTTSEDNGLHFGIDGTWPETAQRWQTVTRGEWHWQSRQRTAEVHVGVPGILTLEVKSAGVHTIHVSMREDGIALDKILLVNRRDYTPEGLGPEPVVKAGTLPPPFPFVAEEGVSLAPAFAGKPLDRQQPLFWEHEGNRAIRVGDWKLVSKHPGGWELYDMAADRTEMNDLAAQQPERVREMTALWDAWAARVGVRPWPLTAN